MTHRDWLIIIGVAAVVEVGMVVGGIALVLLANLVWDALRAMVTVAALAFVGLMAFGVLVNSGTVTPVLPDLPKNPLRRRRGRRPPRT